MAKITKADAGYGPGMPHCGACVHYSEDEESEKGACELVSGVIDEGAWCKLYKAKRRPSLADGVAVNG